MKQKNKNDELSLV